MPQVKCNIFRTHAFAIGAKIYVFTDAAGATPASLYTDSGKGTAVTQPVEVGADGAVNFYCDDYPLYFRTRYDYDHVKPFAIVEGGEDITGLTASVAELNKLTGSGAVVASGTAQSHVANGKTDYTTGDLDAESEIIAALNTTNGKINSILTALEAFGINASS